MHPHVKRRRRESRVLASLASAAVLLTAAFVTAAPSHAADVALCDQYASAAVSGGRYEVQNNDWGNDVAQCVSAHDDGFDVTSGSHNVPTNGAPGAYPSIFAGCHYGTCTQNSGLPIKAADIGASRTSVTYSTADGQWDAAYDIWLDTQPNPVGQNDGTEVMVWGDHQGPPQPFGSQVGTATIAGATWDVWEGRNTGGPIQWNVVSYVRQQTTTSLDFAVGDFLSDATTRGYAQADWYLTSVQFGFEPWQGGPGLGVQSFSFDLDGSQGPGGGGSGSGGTGGSTAACTWTTTVQNAWDGGYVAYINVTNVGTAPADSWQLTWNATNGTNELNGWNGTWTQTGSDVSVHAPDWQPTIGAGQSWSVGAVFTGSPSDPANVQLNGTACARAG